MFRNLIDGVPVEGATTRPRMQGGRRAAGQRHPLRRTVLAR